METAKSKWRIPPRTLDPERLLEEHYGKLQKWGLVLSRGDHAMAQEIVHDLCLHFIVARPDVSQVANLDGYLYTCLRHLYLSAMARSSREALQTLNIADFDSVQLALNVRSSDSVLDRQNQIRRICNYAVWRKDTSKSASYFLLLFFHEYARREVAEIARLPIAAIYNKLKVAREELTSYLEASGKLRIASRDMPPKPELRVSAVSSADLFQELRQSILEARTSECLSEEALLAHYRTVIPKPIPCGLLSHFVSCERCLSLLDRYFERPAGQDREPPGSSLGSENGDGNVSAAHRAVNYDAMMKAVRRQRDRIYEQRPRTLSIAVNGRIVAFHDVQSDRSKLASRAEHPETVQFVEVFTDQQIRLALLPIEELPPEGLHVRTQGVALSDGRRLELTVSFDGQGLHSEVTYLDPALAAEMLEEVPDDARLGAAPARDKNAKSQVIASWVARSIRSITPRFALARAMILVAVVGSAGYFVYRYGHSSLDARTVLNDSVKMEAASMKGHAQHQVLRLDTLDTAGRTVWQGTVDVWQEPANGRYMRRLYDAQHRLVAADWRSTNGDGGSFEETTGGGVSEADRRIGEGAFWKVDISAREFQTMAAQQMKIRNAGGDYELTGSDLSNGPPHMVSATLVLDHHLQVVSETMRMNGGYAFTAARFVEASEEHLPTASVPESVFDPTDLETTMNSNSGTAFAPHGIGDRLGGTNTRLVQTEVAALYRLSVLGADVGEPIEIVRTHGGLIRVAGTVANEARKKQIITALGSMPDHQLLQVDLATQTGIRAPSASSHLTVPATNIYTVADAAPPAEPILRGYFAAKRLTGNQIDAAVMHFSSDALDHARRALQNAYALDRLGTSFSPSELRSMGPIAQQQWSEMVAQHSSALETELNALQRQLEELTPGASPLSSARRSSSIDTPQDFAGAARKLLYKMQDLNREAGIAFSAGKYDGGIQTADLAIDAVRESIPFAELEQLTAFASRLANAKDAVNRPVEQYPRLPR